jgi:hypothetical protein
MASTWSENWLRIRGVEVCFCLFTGSIGPVNRVYMLFLKSTVLTSILNYFILYE